MATLNCSRLFYDVNTTINQFSEQAPTAWKRQHKKQHSKNETRSLDWHKLMLRLIYFRCAVSLSDAFQPSGYTCFYLHGDVCHLCVHRNPQLIPALFLLKHLSWVIFLKQWATKINEAEVLLKAWAWNKDLWAVVSRSQHGRVSLGLEMLISMTSLIRNQFLPPNTLTYLFLNQPSSVWHINKMKNQIPYKAWTTGQTIVISET